MARPRSTERLDEDGNLERRCPRCGEWWPADHEFFYHGKDNLHSWCKACYLEYRKERYWTGKLIAVRSN